MGLRIRHNGKRRVAAAVVLLAALFLLFWSSAYLQRAFFDWASVIEDYATTHRIAGRIVFFVFAALSVLLGPFSSIPLVPFAVGAWGIPETFFLLFAGWLTGGVLSYLIGYYWGYPLVRRLVSMEKIDRWRGQVGEHLEFFILLLFRLAMPSETGYFFGILRYHFLKYLLITAIAELPFALAMVHASGALLAQEPVIFLLFVGGGGLIIIVALLFLRLRLRGKTFH